MSLLARVLKFVLLSRVRCVLTHLLARTSDLCCRTKLICALTRVVTYGPTSVLTCVRTCVLPCILTDRRSVIKPATFPTYVLTRFLTNPPAPKVPRRFYRARIIPQVPQVPIALARGGHFRSRILCFSRFWNRLKVVEDKFVLIFAILKPLVMSALHHLHHLSGKV